MRRRPAARLLITDTRGHVLLFRFEHRSGALAGSAYWATPGGGVEGDESFEQAAIRELWEETGIRVDAVGPQIMRRELVLQLADGTHVHEDERYFHIPVSSNSLCTDRWTAEEVACVAAHHWWSPAALLQTTDTVWPEDLCDLLQSITVAASASLLTDD